jgi:hypothetical protein
MIGLALIVLGYGSLLWMFGWIGLLVAVGHIALLLAALPRK